MSDHPPRPVGHAVAAVVLAVPALLYVGSGLLVVAVVLLAGPHVDEWQEFHFRANIPFGILLALTGVGLAAGRRWAGWLALGLPLLPWLVEPNDGRAAFAGLGAVLGGVAIWLLRSRRAWPGVGRWLEVGMAAVLLLGFLWIVPTPRFHPPFAEIHDPDAAGIFVGARVGSDETLLVVLRGPPRRAVHLELESVGGVRSGDLILIGRDGTDWARGIDDDCNPSGPRPRWEGTRSIPAGGGYRDGEAIIVPMPPDAAGFSDPTIGLRLRLRPGAVPAREQFRGSFCLDEGGRISDYIPPGLSMTGPF